MIDEAVSKLVAYALCTGLFQPQRPIQKWAAGATSWRTAHDQCEKRDPVHPCHPPAVGHDSGGFYQADALTDFLDEVTLQCQYHFFGHYHTNKIIRKK